MINAIEAYYKDTYEDHLEELKEFLRIPSISAVTEHQPDILRCADWLADALRKAGLENIEIMPTAGHPVVYADWLHAPGKPTVLVYGHYDVQPAEPLELWQTPPFEPDIRDGKIFARGATDDKGQVLMHVKAVEAFLQQTGSLPINIKFCIEGEEEIASLHTPPFVMEHSAKLKADVVTVSDTQLFAPGQPALLYGLRGLAAFEIVVEGASSDLHSGLYGGGVQNPVHVLSRLLSSFHDDNGRVAVNGFYDKVLELTAEEREAFKLVEKDETEVKKELSVKELFGEKDYTYYEQTSARPTFEITSITGGFQGEGIKPIVPKRAAAKVACRLAAAQEPDEIMDAVEQHIKKHTPGGVTIRMNRVLRGNPFVTPIDHPMMVAASSAYEEAYGTAPVYMRSGGSIPIVEVLGRLLGAPVVMLGFGLPGENLHAPNEHFHLENWHKGLSTISRFWLKL